MSAGSVAGGTAADAAVLPDEAGQAITARRVEAGADPLSVRVTPNAVATLDAAAEHRRDRETLVAVAVLAALALLVVVLRPVVVPQRTVTAAGSDAAALTSAMAPEFRAQTLDGTQASLSDFKGNVVLINFWATWCPPCVREIPRLVRLSEKYGAEGLVVLGVNSTYQDDPAKVAQFVRDQRISYPVLLDAEAEVSRKYPARLMPTTYIVDRNGRIVHTKVGEVDEAALEEQIKALLQGTVNTP